MRAAALRHVESERVGVDQSDRASFIREKGSAATPWGRL
jgi:hypothetical protein